MVMLTTTQEPTHVTVLGDDGRTLGLIKDPEGPVRPGPRAGTVLLDHRPSALTHPRSTRRHAQPPR